MAVLNYQRVNHWATVVLHLPPLKRPATGESMNRSLPVAAGSGRGGGGLAALGAALEKLC